MFLMCYGFGVSLGVGLISITSRGEGSLLLRFSLRFLLFFFFFGGGSSP